MNRRKMLKTTGLGVAAIAVGSGFNAPACDGVSKDKAVKYAGLTINYLKDILPLASEIGGTEIADLINKAIPQLEKLKTALENAEPSTSKNLFETVTSILGQVNNALFHLPESERRDRIMGILAIVNISLRTVELFVESGAPVTADSTGPRRAPVGYKPSASAIAVRKALEASRF